MSISNPLQSGGQVEKQGRGSESKTRDIETDNNLNKYNERQRWRAITLNKYFPPHICIDTPPIPRMYAQTYVIHKRILSMSKIQKRVWKDRVLKL